MASSVEADIQPFMAESVSLDTRANAHRNQEIDSVLFEDACPNAVNDVVTAAVLDDHRIDAIEMQQLRSKSPAGPAPTMPTWVLSEGIRASSGLESGAAREVGGVVRTPGSLVLCNQRSFTEEA